MVNILHSSYSSAHLSNTPYSQAPSSVEVQLVDPENKVIEIFKLILGENPAPAQPSSSVLATKQFEQKKIKEFTKSPKPSNTYSMTHRSLNRKSWSTKPVNVPSGLKGIVLFFQFITTGLFALYQAHKLYKDDQVKKKITALKAEIKNYKELFNPESMKQNYDTAYALHLYEGLKVAEEIIQLREAEKKIDIYFRIQAVASFILGIIGLGLWIPPLQIIGFSVCAISVFYLAIKHGIDFYREWSKLSELEHHLMGAEYAKQDFEMARKKMEEQSSTMNQYQQALNLFTS